MKKCSALILLACAFALLTAERVAASPVTWDFIATSCISDPFSPPGCEASAQYPLVLAILTLTGPDSSGSAAPGVLSGDPFAFDLVAAQGIGAGRSMVSSADPVGPLIGFPPTPWVTEYLITWIEVGGALTFVHAGMDTVQDGVVIGLTSAQVGTDFMLGGCDDVCQLNGYWTAVSLVTAPEPGSLALLASAFGVWGFTRRRRVLHAT